MRVGLVTDIGLKLHHAVVMGILAVLGDRPAHGVLHAREVLFLQEVVDDREQPAVSPCITPRAAVKRTVGHVKNVAADLDQRAVVNGHGLFMLVAAELQGAVRIVLFGEVDGRRLRIIAVDMPCHVPFDVGLVETALGRLIADTGHLAARHALLG